MFRGMLLADEDATEVGVVGLPLFVLAASAAPALQLPPLTLVPTVSMLLTLPLEYRVQFVAPLVLVLVLFRQFWLWSGFRRWVLLLYGLG